MAATAYERFGNTSFEKEVAADLAAELETMFERQDKTSSKAGRPLRATSRPLLQKMVRRALRKASKKSAANVMEDPATARLLKPLGEFVLKTRGKVSEDNMELLVRAMMPANDPLATVRSRLETDNAGERVKFLNKIDMVTSANLATMAGHTARNKSATASRWKADRRVFSVHANGQELFPAFQFRDGRPVETVKLILAQLPSGMTPWQVAFWFVSSNPWLDGAVPAEELLNPATIDAAARMGEDVEG